MTTLVGIDRNSQDDEVDIFESIVINHVPLCVESYGKLVGILKNIKVFTRIDDFRGLNKVFYFIYFNQTKEAFELASVRYTRCKGKMKDNKAYFDFMLESKELNVKTKDYLKHPLKFLTECGPLGKKDCSAAFVDLFALTLKVEGSSHVMRFM